MFKGEFIIYLVHVNDHNTVIEDEACEVRVFGAFSCSIQAVVGKFVLFFCFCDFGALIGASILVF